MDDDQVWLVFECSFVLTADNWRIEQINRAVFGFRNRGDTGKTCPTNAITRDDDGYRMVLQDSPQGAATTPLCS